MPLADLLALIEALSARIDKDGENLGRYEALTRYALIDPLLRGLGWDTSDPAQVFPEYPVNKLITSGKEFSDYALLGEKDPAAILEAKSLGTFLRDKVLEQTIMYCLRESIRYAIATDGQHWEIYDLDQMGRDKSPDDLRIVEFDIKHPPAEVCLKALALWRPSVLAGQVRVAETPVLGITDPKPESVVFPTTFGSQEADAGWISLAELQAESGDKPTDLKFPNNRQLKVKSWISFMVEIVTDLFNEGHLTQSHAPFKHKTRYILTTSPTPPDGKAFLRARQAGPFHVETNYSGPQMVERAQAIIEHAGLDPAQFRVRLRD